MSSDSGFDWKAYLKKYEKEIEAQSRETGLPWIMAQYWEHLCFTSWPVPVDEMQSKIPSWMDVDVHDGSAWLTVIPFHMSDLHLRDLPPIPTTSNFPEINLRAYVRVNDVPAVTFFSIDAQSHLGAWAASHFFHIPYVEAHMTFLEEGNTYAVSSNRSAHSGFPAAECNVSYTPKGTPSAPAPNSLSNFITGRFHMFLEGKTGHRYRGDMYHPAWEPSDIEVSYDINTIPQAAGFDLQGPPALAQYAKSMPALFWPVVRIED